MNDIISITELSVTEQALKQINAEQKQRLDGALQMACTEETKQAVKNYRTELKKTFEELETERKAKTTEYEEPLKKFKMMYDEYITKPFKEADTELKTKIDEVEKLQKDAKRESVEVYVKELIQAYALTWLDVYQVMPNITLSASEKALKKQVKDTVDRIKSEVDCINAMSDSSEIMAEYMNCLNLADAQMIVTQRKKAIEQAEQAKAAYKEQEEVKQEVTERIEQLAPPVEVEEEKTYTMTFTVSGTMEQLKALKAFMIANNINFTNGGNSNDDF